MKKRKTNIELLRIVSMLLIIAHHFAIYSPFHFVQTDLSYNRFWILLLTMGGKIGVNLFILISGYFLVNTRKINKIKVLTFWLNIFSYGMIILLVYQVFYSVEFSSLIKTLLPISFRLWWFASAYFLLMLAIPFINIMLEGLTNKEHLGLILLGGFLWSILATLTTKDLESNDFLWFVYLYIIAAYIRNNDLLIISYLSRIKRLFLPVLMITYGMGVLLMIIGVKIKYFSEHTSYLYRENNPFILVLSIFIFILFINFDVKSNKFINWLASLTFPVYLIHEHFLIRSFIWIDLLKAETYQHGIWLIPYSILCIIGVYIICTLLGQIMYLLITRHLNKLSSAILTIIPFKNLLPKE